MKTIMGCPPCVISAILLSQYVGQIKTQNISSIPSSPCNIKYLNDRSVYEFAKTDKTFLIEAELEEDNRPCNLSITKPGEDNPVVLNLTMEKRKRYNDSNITLLMAEFGGRKFVKVIFDNNEDDETVRGIYTISHLKFFGFPIQPADNQIRFEDVDNLSCSNSKLKGRVNLTEDFRMCCEYHRFKDEDVPRMVNCCKACLDYDTDHNLNISINYNENYLDFIFIPKEDDLPSPLSVACAIKQDATHKFKMKFKANASKAKCLPEYNQSSIGLGIGLGLLFIACVAAIIFWRKKKKGYVFVSV